MKTRVCVGLLMSVCVSLLLTGCSGTCVAEGERVSVTVDSSPELNDSNGVPQHVRFMVWAVRDAAEFRRMVAERSSELADMSNADRFPQLGRGLDCGEWIKPHSYRSGTTDVATDALYTHVGVVALYAQGARMGLVELACEDDPPRYSKTDGVHSVRFLLGARGVEGVSAPDSER